MGVEVVELLSDAVGVGVTALVPVQLQCLPPHRAGLPLPAEDGVGLAHVVEGVRDLAGVAEAAAQGEGVVDLGRRAAA
ncbi:hypothetical protein ACVDFE_32810 [Lentzea chajnantorensis]